MIRKWGCFLIIIFLILFLFSMFRGCEHKHRFAKGSWYERHHQYDLAISEFSKHAEPKSVFFKTGPDGVAYSLRGEVYKKKANMIRQSLTSTKP